MSKILKGLAETKQLSEQFNRVLEGISQEDLADLLCNRFEMRYPDIYNQYEYETVYDAVNDIASVFAGIDEIGSSDVNIMMRELIKRLQEKSVKENMVMGVSSDASSAGSRVQGEDTEVTENLRKWFKEKWVRFGPDGKIRGACARGDDSEGKPKCLPQSKAHSLGKKGRKYAAAKKRREDPNPERRGPAKNVATKKKTNEEQIDELKCWPGYTRVKGVPAGAPGSCKKKTSEDQAPMFTPESKCPHCGGALFEFSMMNEKKDACYYKVKSRYKVWPSAYASGALVKCRKKGAKNWGNKSESVELNELSTEKLANYKKAAGADARAADKAGDFARGNKRFAGIVKATKKQFDNETKSKKESAIMKGIVDETLGTPYPGTYEQETAAFKSKSKQERITKLTT